MGHVIANLGVQQIQIPIPIPSAPSPVTVGMSRDLSGSSFLTRYSTKRGTLSQGAQHIQDSMKSRLATVSMHVATLLHTRNSSLLPSQGSQPRN